MKGRKLQKELQTYSNKIIEGERPAGKLELLAHRRFLDDCERKDVYFDEEHASQLMKLWEGVCHFPKGGLAGKPIKLAIFQKWVLLNIMCWKNKDGTRKYKTGYVQLARKSTKTFMMALLALGHLMLDAHNAPYIPIGANDEKQAKLCVDMVGKIIERSPKLKALVNPRGKDSLPISLYKYKDQYTQVIYKEGQKDGTIEAISSKAETKDGSEPTFGIIDEYWAAATDDVREAIKTGQMMVEEKMLLTITTAGFNKEGPCYSVLREVGIKVMQGQIEDDANFIYICEPDEEDNWHDESTWFKGNPMADSVPAILENLRIDFKDAKEKGGSTEVHFKTKNLNIWTNASTVWINDEDWMACDHGKITLDDFVGLHCYGGLDLAAGLDLNAFTLTAKRGDDLLVWSVCWIPESKLLGNKDKVDYRRYVEKGEVIVLEGNIIDHRYIAEKIVEISRLVNIASIGYDRKFAYHGCIQMLIEQDIPVNEIIQKAAHLYVPTQEVEKYVAEKTLSHGGNSCLRWQISNVVTYADPEGLYKPDKGRSKSKIDAVVGLVNAVHELMREEEPITEISQLIQ